MSGAPWRYDPTRADTLADGLRRELTKLRDRDEITPQQYHDALADVALELDAWLGDFTNAMYERLALVLERSEPC